MPGPKRLTRASTTGTFEESLTVPKSVPVDCAHAGESMATARIANLKTWLLASPGEICKFIELLVCRTRCLAAARRFISIRSRENITTGRNSPEEFADPADSSRQMPAFGATTALTIDQRKRYPPPGGFVEEAQAA